jgi:HK97 family phage portal protein
VFRAINLRGYSLASLPFALLRKGREIDKEGDEYIALANTIKQWLFTMEASLCIYGSAYLVIEKNQWGRNPTPRPILSSTIMPVYDLPSGVIRYFQRTYNGETLHIPPEDMLWAWAPSFANENAPGTSPLATCLGSAATLHNLNRFAQQFFANGALMPTVFFFGDGNGGMPSTTTPQEIEKFLARMKRVIGGIRNAWKFEALRGNVTAQQIGTPPSGVAAPELTSISRQDVAVAFGIPESLLLSTSSTYASASADMYNVYDLVVIPEAESVILPALQRWFDMIGLTLKWQPELLESYQSYQQQQAQSLMQLTGQPVLTVTEARALLGYGDMEGDEGELSEVKKKLEVLKIGTDAGLSVDQAAKLVDIEIAPAEENSEFEDQANDDFAEMEAEEQADSDMADITDGIDPSQSIDNKPEIWKKAYEAKCLAFFSTDDDDTDEIKGDPWERQSRDWHGRFATMPGSGGRRQDRRVLRSLHKGDRQSLRQAQTKELRNAQYGEKGRLAGIHKAQRQELRKLHATERAKLHVKQTEKRRREIIEHVKEMSRDNPKAMTVAYGNDPSKVYTMRTRVMDLHSLTTSTTPAGKVNPKYDKKLLPRDRSHDASQMQIDRVAKNLVPDAVLRDFHQIDKGTPIIDMKGNVLSGNGRTLALQKVNKEHPEKWNEYKEKLVATAKEHGISARAVSLMQNPVLVRELVGDHNLTEFVKEANAPSFLRQSPLEKAKRDRSLLSPDIVNKFNSKTGEKFSTALTKERNSSFVKGFLDNIPDTERSTLTHPDGTLNKEGANRIRAAMFSAAFDSPVVHHSKKAIGDETGDVLAKTFLDSLDTGIKNFESVIADRLIQIIRIKQNEKLDITGDVAMAISTLARMRENGVTPDEYFILEPDVTKDSVQGRLISFFDSIAASPSRIESFLDRWEKEVIATDRTKENLISILTSTDIEGEGADATTGTD